MKRIGLAILMAGVAGAELKLPAFFSDGMVLQQGEGTKIWGWSDGDAEVQVTFAGQVKTAKAWDDGRWEVEFDELQATGGGADLAVQAGEEILTLEDVLVGEVWVASGQSNMQWTVAKSLDPKKTIAESEDNFLRQYVTPNVTAAEELEDFEGSWVAASPDTTGGFIAVGYHFAKRLREELGVPVGIIECAWGGKPVEAFTSVEALRACPEAKVVLERKAKALENWDATWAAYEEKMAQYQEDLAAWEAQQAAEEVAEAEAGVAVAKLEKPREPAKPVHPELNSSLHSTIYHGMIAPLVGYNARGVIWYQGESNAKHGTAEVYEELLGCMVEDWRERWDRELSFYYVQLANFRKPTTEPGVESPWVTVQDEMRRALRSIPKSGMAVINDIGAADNIHPKNKRDVGARLARWALAKDYGKEVGLLCGPLFKDVEEKDGKMVVSFDYAEGLQTRDGGELKRFEIKAEGGTWIWAQAKIEGEKVVVWSDLVDDPEAVRYAWASNPEGANLVNAEGLPASCFTTE